jgi:hypothetical protein
VTGSLTHQRVQSSANKAAGGARGLHRIESDDAVIRESEHDVSQVRSATEIAWWINPHAAEHSERAVSLNLCPVFLRKKVTQPQHHTKAEILIDLQSLIVTFDFTGLLFLTSKILETLPFRPICGRVRVGLPLPVSRKLLRQDSSAQGSCHPAASTLGVE